jgi:hypothetical protein
MNPPRLRPGLLGIFLCTSAVLPGTACLSEDKPAGTNVDVTLPPDVTMRPPAGDAGASQPLPEAMPLPKSEFVFTRPPRIMAYDVGTQRERVLFESDEAGPPLDLSPDRKWLVTTSGRERLPSSALPIWVIGVDGRAWKKVLEPGYSSRDYQYRTLQPSWAADGSKIFWTLSLGALVGTRYFTAYHPKYVVLDGKGSVRSTDCDGSSAAARSHPTDANTVLLYQFKTCQEVATGLVEYTVDPFAPKRTLVPGAEVGWSMAADWLPDGSGVIYDGDGGLTRIDRATGAKTVLLELADTAKTWLSEIAVGPGGEIIVSLTTKISADPEKTTVDLHRVFPETRTSMALTTDGNRNSPSW